MEVLLLIVGEMW